MSLRRVMAVASSDLAPWEGANIVNFARVPSFMQIAIIEILVLTPEEH